MADAFIDVQLVDDIALPYEPNAEQWLEDWLALAWQEIANLFPGLRLDPLFSAIDPWTLADIADVGRMLGAEPPDPFAWFEIPCDESVADALLPLVEALPFVICASRRQIPVPAGVVSFGTNAEANHAIQLGRAPNGLDAIYAWQVPGGTGPRMRVCDIESGWKLDHEDLLTADITRFSTFGASALDHGTGVLGLLMAADNGVGCVGIAPDATGFVVTSLRANGAYSLPAALAAAAVAVGPGGVVLIEEALNFLAGQNNPDLPMEVDQAVQAAIRLLTAAGVTVIEPAGNGNIDLDAFPFFAHFRPGSPTFVDSGATMVGGAVLVAAGDDVVWSRGSSHGARVDCFGPFDHLRAPSSAAADAYRRFGGTSGASAIIAGVVCAMQGMSQANTGQLLLPSDIRRLLSDPVLGTSIGAGQPAGIGSMPDLRRIARFMGWPRILPPAVLPVADDTAVLIGIDDTDDRLTRRLWSSIFGLLPAIPWLGNTATFSIAAQTPAVMVTLELEPMLATTFEVVAVGNGGTLHYVWWRPDGTFGDLSTAHSAPEVVAVGQDVAAVHPTQPILAVAGISPQGRLVVMIEDAAAMGVSGFTDPLVLDPAGSYRRLAGPLLLSPEPTRMDIIAIEDGGSLRWAKGSVIATIGTGWDPFITASGDVVLEPRAKPGGVVAQGGVAVIAAGTDGLLYSCAFGLAPIMFESLIPVDHTVHVAAAGPLALALAPGEVLVAAAVGADGLLYSATRPLTFGGRWSPLRPVDPQVKVAPLGGASLVVRGNRIMVFAVLPDGKPCRADHIGGTGWTPLRAG